MQISSARRNVLLSKRQDPNIQTRTSVITNSMTVSAAYFHAVHTLCIFDHDRDALANGSGVSAR